MRDFTALDREFTDQDKAMVYRTRNILLIPRYPDRWGGKVSYAEWAHVIGLFQTLFFLLLDRKQGNLILDFGCGAGLLGIAAEPFLAPGGRYIGLDVLREQIEFCRSWYPPDRFSFIHHDVAHPIYNPHGSSSPSWPVDNASMDMVTALSVFTHLGEEESLLAMREVSRTLRIGGRAMITAFLLDGAHDELLAAPATPGPSRYHNTEASTWRFERPCSPSGQWRRPAWADVPEKAIGLTEAGLKRLLGQTSLSLEAVYPGNWKERPGIFFQDILVLRKT